MSEIDNITKACGYCVHGSTFSRKSKCKRYLTYMTSENRKQGGTMLLAQNCQDFKRDKQ